MMATLALEPMPRVLYGQLVGVAMFAGAFANVRALCVALDIPTPEAPYPMDWISDVLNLLYQAMERISNALGTPLVIERIPWGKMPSSVEVNERFATIAMLVAQYNRNRSND